MIRSRGKSMILYKKSELITIVLASIPVGPSCRDTDGPVAGALAAGRADHALVVSPLVLTPTRRSTLGSLAASWQWTVCGSGRRRPSAYAFVIVVIFFQIFFSHVPATCTTAGIKSNVTIKVFNNQILGFIGRWRRVLGLSLAVWCQGWSLT